MLRAERQGAVPSAAELRGMGREGCWDPQPEPGWPQARVQPGLTATPCCAPAGSLLQHRAISGDQLSMRNPGCSPSLGLAPNWESRAESPRGNSHGISTAGKTD